MAAANWTALIAVASSDYAQDRLAVANLLVNAHANLNLHDGYGGTPLYAAVYQGKPELALYLLDHGADPNASTRVYIDGPGGITVLHRATSEPRIVKALIEKGANVNARSSDGETPLHWATRHGSFVKRLPLLQKLRSEDPDGEQAARRALECVTLLLEAGADANVKNAEGRTPMWSVEGEDDATLKEIARLLRAAESKPTSRAASDAGRSNLGATSDSAH